MRATQHSRERDGGEPAPAASLRRAPARRSRAAVPSPSYPKQVPAVSLAAPPKLQGKLQISRPGDAYEREADSVAERIMRMPDTTVRLQRKCACGGTCAECAEEGPRVQRRAAGGAEAAVSVPSAANIVPRSSSGRPLDAGVRAFMEPRFGVDLGHVRVHTDAGAADSARQIGAHAYTIGRDIVFGRGRYAPGTSAGKSLLAHELTHVIQQTGGAGGGGSPRISPAGPSVQRFTDFDTAAQSAGTSLGWAHPGTKALKVSDDGQLAVEDLGWGHSKMSWAAPDKISSANSILKAQGSKVSLKTGPSTMTGSAPDSPKGKTKTLNEVIPVEAATGNPLTLIAACMKACRQVMGIADTETTVPVIKGKSGTVEEFGKPRTSFGAGGGSPDPTAPELWSEELFKKEFGSGLTRAEALKKYNDLPAADKEKFDKKYGINKFAVPTVGQGIAVGTEFDMPGFKAHKKLDPVSGAMVDVSTWNYHFATAILASGKDYVSLENATGSTKPFWVWMYGPASKKQSFDEFQASTLGHGTKQTTLVVEPEKLTLGEINTADAPLVDAAGKVTKIAKGDKFKVIERPVVRDGDTFWKIKMTTGANVGLEGQMMQKYLKLIKT